MTRRSSRLHKSARANADLATLAFTAPMVMGARMAGMWLNTLSPTAMGDRENTLMVSEKMSAGVESVMAINTAIASQMMAAAMVPWRVSYDPHAIVAASIRPYAKRVSSNARRLSRKK